MHVNDTRGFIQHMIVNGSEVESCGSQLLHDWREFVLQENEVAHDHGGIVVAGERRPRAECESWLYLQASNGEVEIGSGKNELVDIAGLLSRAAHRLVNVGRVQTLRDQDHGQG